MEKIALITRCEHGIGSMLARLLCQRDYLVCLQYSDVHFDSDSLVQHLREHGGGVWALRADIDDATGIRQLFDAIDAQFGAVQVLVNHASPWLSPPQNMPMSSALSQYVHCSHAAIERMSTLDGGSGGVIVNVAPYLGKRTTSWYAPLSRLTMDLASAVGGAGIRVNCVHPVYPVTLADNVEELPIPTPRAIAQAITWLVSCEASYVTGTLLEVGASIQTAAADETC